MWLRPSHTHKLASFGLPACTVTAYAMRHTQCTLTRTLLSTTESSSTFYIFSYTFIFFMSFNAVGVVLQEATPPAVCVDCGLSVNPLLGLFSPIAPTLLSSVHLILTCWRFCCSLLYKQKAEDLTLDLQSVKNERESMSAKVSELETALHGHQQVSS